MNGNENENENKFYSDEYEKIRDSIIYGILKPNDNDNELSVLYKEMLYELIMNGKATTQADSTGDSISVDDIFLFLSSYLIPVDYRNQVFDEFDILYMKNNGINEETMKKIKAVSLYLRLLRSKQNGTTGE